jgi:nicotinate-nucleotide adenylyltransferase
MREGVGIMGGTFDPIHLGHLAAAEEVRLRFQLARVIFIPNGRPPHKPDYVPSPAERRYDMVVLATASNPAFEASRIEIDRPGPSYSVDTLRELRHRLGREAEFHFIAGVDALLEMRTWRDPQRLAELCELVAVSRPGYDLHQLQQAVPPALLSRMHLLEVPGVLVSSTELRRRAAAGLSLRYLTPRPVVRYIAAHGLYSHSPADSPAPPD